MKKHKEEIEIKISQFNAERIEAQLNLFQQATWERELKYNDIYLAIELAESMLDNVIDKLNRQNIVAIIRPEHDAYSINYRGDPEETICKIKRKKDGWYLTKVQRVTASRRGSFKVEIEQDSIIAKTDKIIKYLSTNLKC